jgi:hypothetical protein
MTALDGKRTISDAIAEELSPAGFRKKGAHFAGEVADVVHLVSLQSRSTTSAAAVRVRVNLGACVPALEGDARPDVRAAH